LVAEATGSTSGIVSDSDAELEARLTARLLLIEADATDSVQSISTRPELPLIVACG
jgi:hypothetical protein